MKKLFILPFVLLSLAVFAGCADNAASTSKTPASNAAVHDDTGLPPHNDNGITTEDHHQGETNVAPHVDAPAATHDDSGQPPHRH